MLSGLQDAQRQPQLPASLRSAIDHLVVDVARVQGVCEWVTEDLARLPE